MNLRINLHGPSCNHLCLVGMTEGIFLTEKDGACQIGDFNLVEIHYVYMSYAEECQVLDDLIA